METDGSLRGLQWRVGALTLVSLLILLGFFFVVGNPVLGDGVHLAVDYAFVGPVKKGASVRLSGVTVGKVMDVEFRGARPADAPRDHPVVRLQLFVEGRAHPLLTEGAVFHVTTLGVLGEHYVDVVPGPASAPLLKEGAVLRGVDSPRTDLLMARMAQLLEQVGRVLDGNDAQLGALMGSAARMMDRVEKVLQGTDVPAFLMDVQVTMKEARAVLDGARRVLKDPEGLAATLQDGRLMVAEGRTVMADVQVLLDGVKGDVPAAVQRTNAMLGQAEQMSVRVDALLRALEKAGLSDDKRLAQLVVRGETVMDRADKLSARADVLLGRLERGEGTAGKLMKDEAVYEDLKALLSELRANPWKLMVPGR